MGVAAVAGAGMTFAFPALAFASEEEAGGISAILPDMAKAVSLYRHPPGELQHIFSINLTHPFPSADFIFYVLVFLTEGSI